MTQSTLALLLAVATLRLEVGPTTSVYLKFFNSCGQPNEVEYQLPLQMFSMLPVLSAMSLQGLQNLRSQHGTWTTEYYGFHTKLIAILDLNLWIRAWRVYQAVLLSILTLQHSITLKLAAMAYHVYHNNYQELNCVVCTKQ